MLKKSVVLLSLLLVFAMLFTACSPAATTPTPEPVEAPAEETVVEAVEGSEVEGAVGLGMGLVTSIAKSTDAGDNPARAQVDTVIAVALFDAEGRVVDVIIDNAQTRVQYDEEMQVASDKTAEIKTKVELGDDYGMKRVSGIEKEWYEQIAALEAWMVGKDLAEIKAMPVNDNVPDVPELTSSVTISIDAYIEALEKAYNNMVPVTGAAKLGLGTEVSIAKSTDTGDNPARAQVDTTVSAVAFDDAGVVVGAIIDNAQTRVQYDEEGKVTSDKTAEIKSKLELADDYGMGAVSAIGKNWYEQSAALSEWMVGKTVDEITGMNVKEVDPTHLNVPDVPELTSSVTITVESYLATVAEAFERAR